MIDGAKLGTLTALSSLAVADEKARNCRLACAVLLAAIRELGEEATLLGWRMRLGLFVIFEANFLKSFLGGWRLSLKGLVNGRSGHTREAFGIEALALGDVAVGHW